MSLKLFNTNSMRQLLLLLVLLLQLTVFAQVPRPRGGDVGDYGITIPEAGKSIPVAGTYQQQGKYGFVFPGSQRQPAIYEQLSINSDGFIVKKDGLYGIADKQGNLISKIEYESIERDTYRSGNSYIVKKNGNYGSMDRLGKSILAVKYTKVLFSDQRNPHSIVLDKDNQLRMVINVGEKLYPGVVQGVEVYRNAAVLKINGKFGLVKRGQQIVPFTYDSIYRAPQEVLAIYGQKRPIVPEKQLLLDPQTFDRPIGHMVVRKLGKVGLIDTAGKLVYPVEYDQISVDENSMLANRFFISKDKLKGMFILGVEKRIPIAYDYFQRDGTNLIVAGKGRELSAFNARLEPLFPQTYHAIRLFDSSNYLVERNGKKGLLDKTGKVILPLEYDYVDNFLSSGLKNLISVKKGEKYGVVDFQGKVLIPVEFEHVGEENQFLRVVTPDRKFGLYDRNGKLVVPAEYDWITKSRTEYSKLLILRKGAGNFYFMDNDNQLVLNVPVSEYGYIHDTEGLLNDENIRNLHLLYIKGKDGKFGAINEASGKLAIPMIYDGVIQYVSGALHDYFSVRKGNKYGLIDEQGKVVLPIQYDAISLDMIGGNLEDKQDTGIRVVVGKNGKMGTVDLKNQVVIPLVYADLQRISFDGLYKAKTSKYYQLINGNNKVLNAGPFEELANFEDKGDRQLGVGGRQALSFYQGKMRPVDQNGKFLAAEIAMAPHQGYRTFDELKTGLIAALDSKDEKTLVQFVAKIAPSEHILYFLKYNDFNRQPLGRLDVTSLRETYLQALLNFKAQEWDNGRYDRVRLTGVTDFTEHKERYVGNSRREDHAFGDRFLEMLLRNAMKVNGYWISTYFMHRNFGRY